MKHYPIIILLLISALAVSVPSAFAQSRSPEIKIQPAPKKDRKKKESKSPGDTLNFDERPYFLLIEQSEKAVKEGDYEQAGLRLVEAMGVEPDNPLNVALLTNLGKIYYYNEQDSMALVTLDEAIRRAPKLIAAHEGRARVLNSMRRDREAYDEYARIIELDSLNTDARFYHGMMSLYNGNLPAAEADIALLNRVIPLNRKAILATSTLYSMTGRELDAISGFRKLIEIEKLPEYYSQLVACLLTIDNLDEASKMIGEGLEFFPSDPELYYYRAILNKRRYLPEDAHRDAKRAIELGVDPAKVMKIFDVK